MVGLGDLSNGSFSSEARGVSADGSVAVGIGSSTSGTEAFRWTEAGGMVGLGDLAGGSYASYGYGVSADGSVVVGYSSSTSGTEAFRWTEAGGMVGLGDLPGGGFYSYAYDVSADGSVVVGYSGLPSVSEAFIWDEDNGMQSLQSVLEGYGLDLSGWALRRAYGISDDGTVIVGWGTNPLGSQEAFLADLSQVPIPSGLWLLGSGLIALLGIRRRTSER